MQIVHLVQLVFLATLVVRSTGFLKDIVVAGRLGTSDAVDAFVMALAVPTFLSNAVASSLAQTFIPVYTDAKRQCSKAKLDLFRSVFFAACVVTVTLSIVLICLRPWLFQSLTSSFDREKSLVTSGLFCVVLPVLVLDGLTRLFTAVLNVEGSYFAPALSPILVPLTTIAFLVLFEGRLGVYALAYGMVAGTAGTFLVVSVNLKRRGLLAYPKWHGWDANTKRVLHQYLPILAGAFVMGGTSVMDKVMASSLPSGSIATLSYGNKITTVALIGATAIGTAALPRFSRFATENDLGELSRVTVRLSLLVIALTTPVVFFGVLASPQIVSVAYERGAFDHDDVQRVANVQAAYCLQVPAYVLSIVFGKALIAMGRTAILAYGAVISLSLNFGFNVLMMRYYGAVGIAFSTSIVMYVSALFLGIALVSCITSRTAVT